MFKKMPECLLIGLFALAGPDLIHGQSSAEQEPTVSRDNESGGSTLGGAPPPRGRPIHRRHDEVVVTATRTPTALGEIGQALTTISAREIQAHGNRNVLEILETVPGFDVVRGGSFGAATSLFVRGGENNFNLVLVDGVPMNQPGGDFDFGDLTTANIERIEIVRGPASVLYGADAATSVIHLITRKGDGKPSGDFAFETGSYRTYVARGNIQGAGERVTYAAGLHYSETEGFYDFNNHHDRLEFSGRASFDLTPASLLSSSVRFTDARYQVPTDSTGAVVDPNDYRQTEQLLYSVSYQYLSNRILQSKLHYGYSRKNSESFIIRDDIEDFFDTTVEVREDRQYLDWQNSIQFHPQHLVTGGVSFARESSESVDLSRRSLGLYLQEQFSWDRLSLTAGLRFDHNNRFNNFTTATLSAGYRVDQEFKLRASLGNGVRAPSFVEIVGFPEFGINGNPDLRPERNVAADFGLDYFSRDGRINLAATVFFNRFSELVEFSFFVPTGTPNYINVEKAKSHGLELEASLATSDRLRWGGQYTFTDTEVTDAGTVPGGNFAEGETLLRRPRHMAGLFGELGGPGYTLRVDIKHKGAREDLQFFPDFSSRRITLPSYSKVDLALTFPLLRYSDAGEMALLLRGENLFNKRYFEIAGFESVGRGVWAGLRFGF